MTTPIVDAHVHLWEPRARAWYPALHRWSAAVSAPVLLQRHLLEDYLAAVAGGGAVDLAGLVVVSATTAPHAYLDEATWLEAELARSPVPAVTIGTVDPTLDATTLRHHLDRQADLGRLRGVRVYGGLEPDTPATTEILRWLHERGLVFDLVGDVASLPAWQRALEPFDGLSVVLEHLGSPRAGDADARATWLAAMGETARATDWSCKFSGLGMLLPEITTEALRPWLAGAVEAWGWPRLTFGSNLPMDATATSHRNLFDVIRALVGELAGPAEERAFLCDNAARMYDLA